MEEVFLAAQKGAEWLQQHEEFVKSVALTVGSAMFVYAGFRWATASGRAQVIACRAERQQDLNAQDEAFGQVKSSIEDNFVHAGGVLDAHETKRVWRGR